MKKRVFAMFLASLLAISQVGAALSETADLTVEPTATVVISTPAPTLQAIIEALVENTTEPTPEVTEEPGVETEEPGVETEEPGVETEEPGVETEEPGVETEEPGVETEEPGVETEEPGDETEEPGDETEEPGVETEEPGDETEEPGDETEEPGVETEEPGDETEESGDETKEPGDEGTETVPTAFSVKVEIVTVKDVYYVGDTIRIESSITGTCYAPVYQWQVDKGDGEWKDIEGATDWYYEYEIDMDNCSWLYRVVICDAEAVEG